MFKDREEAGILLGKKLKKFVKLNSVILAIPRGGVVVGSVISNVLNLSFDVLVVRKIGAPHNPELAIGAVGPGKTVYWDRKLCKNLGVEKSEMAKLKSTKYQEVLDREKTFRNKKPLDVAGKIVILVDDGVATGATVIVAQKYLKKINAKEVILAVPVISTDVLRDIKRYFDIVVALKIKENFYAVGEFYKYFPQVEDNEVVAILNSKQ